MQALRAFLCLAGFATLTACNTASQTKIAPVADPNGPGPAAVTNKHPLAKYIELAGFRLSEGSPGKLKVQFVAINHSDADLGELAGKVKLVVSNAKPEDPPITDFDVKIPELGPLAIRNVEATATTKLRLYELPDWQFLRAHFEITSPAP